jgi:protease-4
MKQFFAAFFGTITGLIVTFFLIVIILFAVIAGAVGPASKKRPFAMKEKSVLHLTLDKEIPERSSNNPFANFNFSSLSENKEPGVNDIVTLIHKAKTDDKISGIFLELTSIHAGMATIEEIRNALLDFKTSKKFIISYGEVYSQGAYYLASTADKVYLNPQGEMIFKGFSAQVMFFKGMLEKLEIQPQIFRHGKFKSAIEPFILDKMSDANREQTRKYITSLWGHLLEGISKSRKISTDSLAIIANNILIQNAEDAVKYKMVDDLKYKDEILDILKTKLSLDEKKKINFITLNQYNRDEDEKTFGKKDKIAVIYAVGAIGEGDGNDESIGSERISTAIREARKDSSIKAIVLRVNSPGGSALASDVIWREVALAEKAKPVVVSMGDVAASGGYYISCAADVIVAQPNTITGSIGVFGILPNLKNFFNNKLGITVDTVNTNTHSDFGSPFRAVNDVESIVIQKGVEDIYTTFVRRVAEGRKMTPEQIDSLGQGRVWSGADAKAIGLVDELGGLEDAIKIAAKKAKLENYKLDELPKQKDPFQELIKEFSGDVSTSIMKSQLKENYDYFMEFKKLSESKGIMAQMPYEIKVY